MLYSTYLLTYFDLIDSSKSSVTLFNSDDYDLMTDVSVGSVTFGQCFTSLRFAFYRVTYFRCYEWLKTRQNGHLRVHFCLVLQGDEF